jgi:hypothetical protein
MRCTGGMHGAPQALADRQDNVAGDDKQKAIEALQPGRHRPAQIMQNPWRGLAVGFLRRVRERGIKACLYLRTPLTAVFRGPSETNPEPLRRFTVCNNSTASAGRGTTWSSGARPGGRRGRDRH